MPLRAWFKTVGLWFIVLASTARADEWFSFLKVNGAVYTNVTVTLVTPTDIYFNHAKGLASAKLKDLDPELQKHFHFDAASSAQIERANIQATEDLQAKLARQKPVRPRPAPVADAASQVADAMGPDFVVDTGNARSVRGHAAPALAVEKWLTPQPETDGQFVMITVLATWNEASLRSVPVLNGFQKRYRGRLVVIGVSEDPESEVLRFMPPASLEFTMAVDTQARMRSELEATTLPYCLLIDPTGVVRFEGNPTALNDGYLNHFLLKYLKGDR